MSKQSLLLVDGDTRSLRVLEVSLRKAGFMVTAASSVQDALDKLALHAPDLIISETTFPDGDGFELRRRVRATQEWSEIPFIFLTAEAAIENKIRGLELGVDDYLTKPIYIKEIVTRINILLQKRQRVRFEERRDGRTRFTGRVQDMPVVDVIQTIEISRKSGVIQFVGERGRQAAIYFRDGRVIDAEAGALQGEDAVYRLLTWSEGEFEVVFRTVRRREVITMSSQGLLMEGMRRLDEWSRLFEQLPPLTHRFEVDTIELAARLGDVPDDNNRILRLFDGKRTLLEVIDASDVGDLECLQAISRLYFEELLLDLDHGKTPRRDTGKSLPLVELEAPATSDESASGPTALEAPPATSAPARSEERKVAAEAGGAQRSEDDREASFAEGDDVKVPTVAGAEAAVDRGAEAGPTDAGAASAGGGKELEDGEEVGPLMGGYRPSSLRLIDEAVAAAQAIEPSLFDEMLDEQLKAPGEAHVGNGVARTITPQVPEPAPRPSDVSIGRPAAVESAAHLRAAEREESGLRMIGSLGRDRAEASGELAPLGRTRPLRSETARELVTILPRRATREMPVVSQDLESLPTPTPTSPVLAPRPSAAHEAVSAPASMSQRISLPGSGVTATTRWGRLLRMARSEEGGPGLGPLLLIVLAVVLAGTAVVLRLRRHSQPAPRIEERNEAAQPSGLALPVAPSADVLDAGADDGDVGEPASSESDAGIRDGGARAGRRDGAATSSGLRDAGMSATGQRDAGASAMGQRGASAAGVSAAGAAGQRDPGASAAGAGGQRDPGVGAAGAGGQRDAGAGAAGAGGQRDPGASAAGAGGQRDPGVGAAGAGRQRDPGASAAGAAGQRDPGASAAGAAGQRDAGVSAAGSAGGMGGAGHGESSAANGGTSDGRASAPERADGAGDKVSEAKALFDKAHDALDEGDFARAFAQAEASLRLRKTARTYLLRAQAEQRLDRVDDALASVAAAAQLAPTFSTVWELRGRILWAARRRDEARVAFEKFLALDPNSPKAASIRRLVNEPR